MKFVVAVDGSEQSDRALAFAIDLVDSENGSASLRVVHAVDPQVFNEGGVEPVDGFSDIERRLVIESVEDAERRGLDILEDAAADAAQKDVAVETELLYGDPVAQIPQYVDAEDLDCIVVGHRGLDAHYERVLGSVAKGILERASVPVTVVR